MSELFTNAATIYEGVTKTLAANKASEIINVKTITESPVIKKYLDGDLTGNTDAKKIIATAIAIGNKKGYISLPQKYSNPESIGSIADKAMDTIKLAHDVGAGKLTADDAIEYGINKAAAIVKTTVDKLIDKSTSIVSKVVSELIEKKFPPAKVLRPVIKLGTKFIAEKAKPLIHKGIDKITQAAKTIVRNTFENVKTTVRSVVKNVGGKVLSFFGF